MPGKQTARADQRQIVATTRYRDDSGESRGSGGQAGADVDLRHGARVPAAQPQGARRQRRQRLGTVSGVIAALQYIQRLNGYGRRLLVHGVNLSVGYDFEPEWFACGQSPLCVEVDRLVRSGVVVVVAAGNSGYGVVTSRGTTARRRRPVADHQRPRQRGTGDHRGLDASRHAAHLRRVVLFVEGADRRRPRSSRISSRPARRSCRASRPRRPKRQAQAAKAGGTGDRRPLLRGQRHEQAAPHVSGVIAAFLSIRREFLQHPEEVKRIFMSTATDLNRERYFQGRGLVDVMRAIQSV